MKKIEIFNRANFLAEITDKDNPHKLIFNNVSENATINVSIERDNQTKKRFITPLTVPFLLEAQNKIERLQGNLLRTYRYQKSDIDAGDPNVYKKTIASAHIEIAIGGEILLANKDTVEVDLKNLSTVSNTTMTILGGMSTSSNLYTIGKTIFEKGQASEKIDVQRIAYLIFDKTSLPDEIEFMYGQEKITIDKDYILTEQEDAFGVVCYDENNAPVFGTDKAVVISLKGATSCYLKMYEDLPADLTYYTV